MQFSREVEEMVCVKKGPKHGPAPIPEEGKWVQSKEIKDISGLTHGVGWCAPQQGACKLTLNVKDGIIPVSYTHLDVYKRQAICQRQIQQICRIRSAGKGERRAPYPLKIIPGRHLIISDGATLCLSLIHISLWLPP